MNRAARQRATPRHPRSSAATPWLPILAVACLWAAAAHAGQRIPASAEVPVQVDPVKQDAAVKPDAVVKPHVATRGISAQAANDAAAAQLEPVGQDEQAAQAPADGDAQPASSGTAGVAAEPGAQPAGSPAGASSGAAAVTVGATHGVLFRIYPPPPTTLPGELAADEQAPSGNGAPANASGAAAAAMQAAATAPRQQPSYLLGTIHFGTPEEQGVDYSILEGALKRVDTFVNEANLDEPWQASYDDYRWLSPAQPLSAMVSKDSYAMARSLLPNVRPQDLVRMKPWSVLALLEARGETGGKTTMDARLQRIASESGKRLVHLETLEQQLQALDCVPASEHALVLDERLRAPWILRDESAAAMTYYRNRNLDAWLADIDHMYGLSYAGKAIEQRSRQCLLEARNARWVGQLETLFQDGPSFVAVGAVHLVGPHGLIAALRRDGYRVEEVPL